MDGIKCVLVTGATGLLGTNLVNRLLKDGCEVRAVLRNPERYIGLKTEKLHLIQKGLFEDFSKDLKNADVVIHIAAQTAQNIFEYEPYRKINFEATKHLYEAAVKARVPRFIFISTANTSGFGGLKDLGLEEKPMKPPFTKSFYALSKKEAEDFLLAQNDDIQIKILCPTFMIGANDVKPSSGRIIQMGLNKKVIFYPPGGKNFVYVGDVVQAIIQSFSLDKNKGKWIINNENLNYCQFFQKLCNINHQKSLLIGVPKILLLAVGILGDMLRKFRIKTDLCTTNMQSLCIQNYYTNTKSKKDLKIKYTPIDRAIQEAVDYFKNDFQK